jgi:hypothetical protein
MRTFWHAAGSAARTAVLLNIKTPQLIRRINLFMRAPSGRLVILWFFSKLNGNTNAAGMTKLRSRALHKTHQRDLCLHSGDIEGMRGDSMFACKCG